MTARIDESGKRYGRWSVIAYAGNRVWTCRCDCGTVRDVHAAALRRGTTTSCGCARADQLLIHGHARKRNRTGTYRSWYAMIQRCTNTQFKQYNDYGGRGISVCPEWREFARFLADMGERPEGLTLDRIDNYRGYARDNCRWATRSTQQLNRRCSAAVS